jgi:hypothetical protein
MSQKKGTGFNKKYIYSLFNLLYIKFKDKLLKIIIIIKKNKFKVVKVFLIQLKKKNLKIE